MIQHSDDQRPLSDTLVDQDQLNSRGTITIGAQPCEFLRISKLGPENARTSSLLNSMHVWKIQNGEFVAISQKAIENCSWAERQGLAAKTGPPRGSGGRMAIPACPDQPRDGHGPLGPVLSKKT
jgi:hypothetical protein